MGIGFQIKPKMGQMLKFCEILAHSVRYGMYGAKRPIPSTQASLSQC